MSHEAYPIASTPFCGPERTTIAVPLPEGALFESIAFYSMSEDPLLPMPTVRRAAITVWRAMLRRREESQELITRPCSAGAFGANQQRFLCAQIATLPGDVLEVAIERHRIIAGSTMEGRVAAIGLLAPGRCVVCGPVGWPPGSTEPGPYEIQLRPMGQGGAPICETCIRSTPVRWAEAQRQELYERARFAERFGRYMPELD